jgi:cell division protein FtsQ
MIHNSPRKRSILNVKVRAATARKKRQRLLTIASAWTIGIALFATAAWFGVSKTLDRFFYSNPSYNLSELTVELDGIMTGEDLVAITGIKPGDNVFNIDLAEAGAKLRAIPMVQDACLERFLPDRIKITLVSRRPVAWAASRESVVAPYDPSAMLLADDSGFLMKPMLIRQEHHQLPVIHGLDESQLRSGHPVENTDFSAALMLLRQLRLETRPLVSIRSIDISKGYCLDALTADGCLVKFSPVDFPPQLEKLERLLEHCRDTGRSLESVNLMVARNTPVVFAMASLPPAIQPAKQAPKPKTKSRN